MYTNRLIMDLYSGLPFSIIKNPLYDLYEPLRTDISADVMIIGSGITGALVAHRLCAAGIPCTMVDRRTLSTGSTAASTSQLQYEIDVPLSEMVKLMPEDDAVQAYWASLRSISDIEQVFVQTGIDCGFRRSSSLFLASDKKGLQLIEEEYSLRTKHGLPVQFLDSEQLEEQHGIKAPGALKNYEAAQMDSYLAATQLIRFCRDKNLLQVYSHTQIDEWEKHGDGYILRTEHGHTIRCRYLVIATGYESELFLQDKKMQLSSTYAIASQPVDASILWKERCLVWETKTPYFYVRTTPDNRMMIGGEDLPYEDPIKRDKLLPAKVKALEEKFASVFPSIPFITEMAWCGTFSSTADGLPYIGEWPGRRNMLFALGYGGNGITFSMIAAQVILNKIKGIPDDRERIFGFERG